MQVCGHVHRIPGAQWAQQSKGMSAYAVAHQEISNFSWLHEEVINSGYNLTDDWVRGKCCQQPLLWVHTEGSSCWRSCKGALQKTSKENHRKESTHGSFWTFMTEVVDQGDRTVKFLIKELVEFGAQKVLMKFRVNRLCPLLLSLEWSKEQVLPGCKTELVVRTGRLL